MYEVKGGQKAGEQSRWLENAAKARAAAEVTTDPAARELYLKVAASWQRLAQRQDWYENALISRL